ncbi:hypothetical protein GCM10009718_13390 [Isoptericola halotolerans]|uniref:Uncharacterized protein n=1 Tax=Isoptericola halotolerans TaxID=300560 RepID=A0ABX1ZZK4_9MICO|nr:hypothetical protein [Isoptericola halotolerans]NOV95741.1 hypothetical protein [Isoptericola halotolerans]
MSGVGSQEVPRWARSRKPPGGAAGDGRPRRRRRWLWVPTGFVALLGLTTGLQLTFAPLVSSWGVRDYTSGDLETASDRFRAQAEGIVPQQWRADYNLGTSLAAQAVADERGWLAGEGADRLEAAYAGAEDQSAEVRCAIVTNWAAALEISGDTWLERGDELAEESEAVAAEIAKRDAGKPYDEEVIDPYGEYGDERDPEDLREQADTNYWLAEYDYGRTQRVRSLPDCADSSQTQDATEAQERAQEKEQQAHDAQTENQGAPEPEPEPATPEEAEAQRQESLGERNEQAARDVEMDEAEARELGGTGDDGDTEEDVGEDTDGSTGGDGDGDEGEGPGSLPRNW